MEQFRHIGEVLGSVKALMVLRDEIEINQRQCSLILDIFSLAFETIAEEIRQNLKLEERNTKWKPLEFPLREICRVFKEGELYIRQCLDSKEWWGKAMTLSQNRDCIEFHIHNLLCYFPAVIEAIENVGEVSGVDDEEKEKKKVMLSRKYDMEWNDPKLFQWRFGKQYLVPRDICKQLDNAWREDRWRLVHAIEEKRDSRVNASSSSSRFLKNESFLADMMLKKLLNESTIFPIMILFGSNDYQVRRRLGRGREFKEIQWLGQSFALRHFQAEKGDHESEVSSLLLLSHPNILQYLCAFYDDDKKEFSLVMELMNKDLWTYMKENCGPRRQILFSIPVVVDLMLQMARGMEYLHSKNIYHGDLNPCNILLKPRNSQEGYFQAKVAGFGLSSINNGVDPINEDFNPSIWYAPEVLAPQERNGDACSSKYSEKADAYSFGMICFQLLTGKVPFEDNHLQGERTIQNIKAGERPLFPYRSPKYLVNLVKKCWQPDPAQRPSFSSICRILRYTKNFLSMNTECQVINHELHSPPVDCYDIEATFLKRFPDERASNVSTMSQIPYEMFAYKVAEKGKIIGSNTKVEPSVCKCENDDRNTVSGDDNVPIVEHSLPLVTYPNTVGANAQSVCSETPSRKSVTIRTPTQVKAKKDQGTQKLLATKSLPSTLPGRVRANKVNQPSLASNHLSPIRRRPTQVSELERNSKGNPSPLPSIPSSSVRRKKVEGGVPDSKSSLKLKKRDQSPIPKHGNFADSNGSLKMKKSQLMLNPSSSLGRLRRANTEIDLKRPKGFPPIHALSTSRACTSRRCGHVSYLDGGLKVTRGRLSPLALSPLSPFVRSRKTCDQIYDSESSFEKKSGSLSPLALSPLRTHVTRTSGHVSD